MVGEWLDGTGGDWCRLVSATAGEVEAMFAPASGSRMQMTRLYSACPRGIVSASESEYGMFGAELELLSQAKSRSKPDHGLPQGG